jgi:predicted NAD/FAD-binding protein
MTSLSRRLSGVATLPLALAGRPVAAQVVGPSDRTSQALAAPCRKPIRSKVSVTA